MAAFVLEDFSQTFCQFLFFEKFQTSLDYFSVANGVVMIVLGFLFLKTTIQSIRSVYKDWGCTKDFTLSSLMVMFPITVIGTQIVRLALIVCQSTRRG